MNTTYDQTSSDYDGADSIDSINEPDSPREQPREGKLARTIERQTAKVPSDVFLWAAGAALAGSLVFQVIGMNQSSMRRGIWGRQTTRAPLAGFVGQWVPTLLLFGIYNKIVKVAGSDRASR